MIYLHGYKNYNPKYFPMKTYRLRRILVAEATVEAPNKKEAKKLGEEIAWSVTISPRIKATEMTDEIDRS